MATAIASASPLFLREPEIRRGMELMYFAQSTLARSTEEQLSALGLGRAHHRALYFIARHPDLTVSALLGLLGITKQS
ncbi:MarR family transcriptional regulator, partial [Pseudomonas sp. FW305-130]